MKKERCFFLSILELTPPSLVHSRHSDAGERVKSYAASAKGNRGEKTREDSFYFSLVNCSPAPYYLSAWNRLRMF